MAEITTKEIREFLVRIQGQRVSLRDLRTEFNILPGTKSFDLIRSIMFQLAEQKVVKSLDRGEYKVITQVQPVRVFTPGRERRPIVDLIFPRDRETGLQMLFAEYVVFREGDLITFGGIKSKGKTALCIIIAGENIDKHPILLGNEYTQLVPSTNGKEVYEPSPRFFNRLDIMKEWVDWTDSEGNDKFVLLPVRADYELHVRKDKINIIDWINIDAGKLYNISSVLEAIKGSIGRGVAIVALQKGEGAVNPRGGQFVRDFSDLEILLDGFGDNEDNVLLTIKGCKEKTAPIVGRTYTYTLVNSGTQIVNFREVKTCTECRGNGYTKAGKCDKCYGTKYLDK